MCVCVGGGGGTPYGGGGWAVVQGSGEGVGFQTAHSMSTCTSLMDHCTCAECFFSIPLVLCLCN